ncbi:unnamed protein product, partial [Brenthis ino]
MSLNDPLGLLSHYTIRAKIILQSLWRMKMAWDEQIPAEENEMCAAWLRQLPDLTCLRLERCYALEARGTMASRRTINRRGGGPTARDHRGPAGRRVVAGSCALLQVRDTGQSGCEVLAFVDKCRRRATGLEHRHIEKAERALIRRAQRNSFQDELLRMKSSHPLPKTSRLFRLDPVLQEGVLRGRIRATTAPLEMKRPIILDGRHRVTKLIVLREHCAAGHANQRECALCKVRRAKPQVPSIGDLPRARLEPFRRPFTHCGVDYFGPMMVKIGRRASSRDPDEDRSLQASRHEARRARSAAPRGELLRTTSDDQTSSDRPR